MDSERIRIDGGGEIGELAGAFNDMMDVLRHTSVSKDFVDGIVEHMLNGPVVCDRDDRVIRFNREVLRLLGYTAGDLVGQPVRILFPDDACLGEAARDQAISDEKSIKAFETSLRGRDGAEVPVLFPSSRMRNAGGSDRPDLRAAGYQRGAHAEGFSADLRHMPVNKYCESSRNR